MRRLVRATVALGVVATFLGPAASGQVLPADPWLDRRVLNIAHQGGEMEAPSYTLFAFKTALEKGADVLELDMHATLDRELVVSFLDHAVEQFKLHAPEVSTATGTAAFWAVAGARSPARRTLGTTPSRCPWSSTGSRW